MNNITLSSEGKIIILSAPSGSGKSTIIKALMPDNDLKLEFSISATSRAPRGEEKHGCEYYFYSDEEFMKKVAAREFVEWEEVYPGCHYGTLHSEVDRITSSGKNLIMDIDVKGALNMKETFGNRALSIFIMPPDISTLYQRLRTRGTDTSDIIARRIAKAEYEMTFAPRFDALVINDALPKAIADVRAHIMRFLKADAGSRR